VVTPNELPLDDPLDEPALDEPLLDELLLEELLLDELVLDALPLRLRGSPVVTTHVVPLQYHQSL
jgi:hypothetical protein